MEEITEDKAMTEWGGRWIGRCEEAAFKLVPIVKEQATETGAPPGGSLAKAERVIGLGVERHVKGSVTEDRVKAIMEDVAEDRIGRRRM